MGTNETDEIEINLLELWYVIRSKLWIILIVGLLAGAIGGVGSKMLLTPMYSSTTKIYIVNKPQSLSSLSLSDLQIGTQLTKDYMVLIKSRPVTEQVIENLGFDMEHEELLDILTISNPSDTRILQISAEYKDAYMAKAIVDEMAKVSVKRISQIMDISEPNVVEEGIVPELPVSPKVKKNAVIAAVVGVIVTCGIIFVRFMLDDTIKTSEDIEKYIGIPTIGTIPVQDNMLDSKRMDKNKQKKHFKKKQSAGM